MIQEQTQRFLRLQREVAFDMGRQLTVTSAFRTPELNRRCGGALVQSITRSCDGYSHNGND